uniref:Uncharacterized protein n=1 Tax=Anguilla anguilla TaxID=7936 RepID=A0A0E9RM40_ANGAN
MTRRAHCFMVSEQFQRHLHTSYVFGCIVGMY